MPLERSHMRRAATSHQRQRKATKERLVSARSAWQNLSIATQMRLAREIVLSRRDELRHAYRNVVSLGHGFRTKGKRRRLLRDKVVVKFIVQRKWDKKSRPKRHPAAIPSELMIYDGPLDHRVLIAVPTDVECGRRYRKFRPAGLYINANAGNDTTSGVFACVVGLPNSAGLYAVGCEHVLGMTDFFYPNDAPSGLVQVNVGGTTPLAPNGPTVGGTSDYRGYLVDFDSSAESFDCALCTLALDSAIDQVMPTPRPTGSLEESDSCPSDFVIWTARSGAVRTGYSQTLYNQPVQYSVANGIITVIHPVLIEAEMTAQHGDSGSPAISLDGAQFIGMLISIYSDSCLLLPAWSLLDAGNYHGLPVGQLQLTNAY